MAPLASAFIRLRSDSSFLASDVRRDATKAGAEGGTVMGREFGTAFRRVSRTLIGLGIGTFAVEAGRYAIDMADKFELSRSRLETVTKNLGGDFTAVSGQITALDDRLAAFGFTNADVEGSVASLETATKSLPKALKDAALAADIARGRNISLESATQILMRVETGHVAMLSRLGIATTDSTGHLLTQKEALTQLATIYGGSASHFAGTFAGKQQALRAELGNSAAEIGVALLPAVVDLAKVLQHDVLPAVQSTAQYFDRNRKTIEPLVGLVIKLALAYKALKLAQKGLATFQALKGAGAAGVAAGGVSQLGLEAFTVAHPLPVLVVNNVDPGAPFPVKPGGKTPPIVPIGKIPAELPALGELGAKRFPLYGVGANSDLKVPPVPANVDQAYSQAVALIHQLPKMAQDAAFKALTGVVGTRSVSHGLVHDLLFGKSTETTVDTQKLAALEGQWRKLGAASRDLTTSVHAQAKALAELRTPLFTSEGPKNYAAAYAHNKPFAVGGTYQTKLSGAMEGDFRRWVAKNKVPFDPNAATVDYDMRGYWLSTAGRDWVRGQHFPDTFKTPYDTTFSGESKYAKPGTPFAWKGNNLIDTRSGQLIFGSMRKAAVGTEKLTAAERALHLTSGATVKDLAKAQASALALSTGLDDLRSAIHNMAVTAGTQGSKALRGNSDAALANRDALRQAVTQAQTYVAMLKKQGVNADKVHGVEVGLAKAIKQNAINTYGNRDAVVSLLGQLGYLPGVLQKIIDKYAALDGFRFGKPGAYQPGGNATPDPVAADPKAAAKGKAAGEAIGKAVVGGYTPVVTQGVKAADQAVKAAADQAAAAAKAAFAKVQQQMRSDFAQMKQFYASQRASLISTFSTIDPSAASTDLLGTAGAPTPFLTQIRRGAREMDTFTRLWLRLESKHLDPRLLQMFEGLGPEAIPTMRLWAQHPRNIRRADRLESRIGRDASRISATATQDKYGRLIHEDLTQVLPEKLGKVLRRDLKNIHIHVDLNAIDRKDGQKVQHS